MEERLHEICRVDKNYGIFADFGQGGKYIVLAGKGVISDIISGKIPEIREKLTPTERGKLDVYLS